jgi:CarD family transcriptional regulator
MIPAEHIASIGLRQVISKEMATEVYRILRTRKPICDRMNWTRRYKDYNERIRTGSIIEIAKIFRDLLASKSEKELSFSERTMLDTVRNLLVEELAVATCNPEEKILAELRDMFITNAARLALTTRS